MRKLVVLTSRFPYPLEKGDKLRVYYQIKALSQKYDITLITLSEHPVRLADIQHLQGFCRQIHRFRLRSYQIFFNLVRGFFSGLPLQVSYFYSPSINRKIQQLVRDLNPDHIYCQLIRMAPYAQGLSAAKTIDYMDAFSVGMQRRALQSKGIAKYLFNVEAKRLQAYEAHIFQAFQHHTVISHQDRALLQIPEKERIHVIPNGVDTDFFKPDTSITKTYHLAFVGNMGYHPNIEAAKFLVKSVLPLVQETFPNLKVLIAGARPSPEVKRLENDQVRVSGWVKDIREAYQVAQLFVGPIFLGSGQQNKILEAMAMGLPCITSPQVNNAIAAPVNTAILVAASAETFAQQIIELLQAPERQIEIGGAARAFVQQHFSWQHSTELLSRLF